MLYEKFETLLQERGVKASDVARGTGITTGTLSAWKKGKYEPKQDKIQKIADFFNVPLSYFYDNDAPPTYYYDSEVAELAEMIHKSPGRRGLFNAIRNLSEESVDQLTNTIEALKKTNPDG